MLNKNTRKCIAKGTVWYISRANVPGTTRSCIFNTIRNTFGIKKPANPTPKTIATNESINIFLKLTWNKKFFVALTTILNDLGYVFFKFSYFQSKNLFSNCIIIKIVRFKAALHLGKWYAGMRKKYYIFRWIDFFISFWNAN